MHGYHTQITATAKTVSTTEENKMGQTEEIIEALNDYYKNPEDYTFQDLEDIFQDRDPTEFL